MAVKVKVSQRGGQKFKRQIDKAQRAVGFKRVEVGFFSDAKYQDGTPVPEVAAINEFGDGKRKERPFFRNAIQSVRTRVKELLRRGVSPETMVVNHELAETVGKMVKTEIQESIFRLKVIDTGHMRRSTSWRTIR